LQIRDLTILSFSCFPSDVERHIGEVSAHLPARQVMSDHTPLNPPPPPSPSASHCIFISPHPAAPHRTSHDPPPAGRVGIGVGLCVCVCVCVCVCTCVVRSSACSCVVIAPIRPPNSARTPRLLVAGVPTNPLSAPPSPSLQSPRRSYHSHTM
jgi:hypothetical protein